MSESQQERAWLILDTDLKITKFDIEKCRRMAADPNQQVAATASVIVQLIDQCADLAQEHVYWRTSELPEKIRNLKIGDL